MSNLPDSFDDYLAQFTARYPTFQIQLDDLVAAGDSSTVTRLFLVFIHPINRPSDVQLTQSEIEIRNLRLQEALNYWSQPQRAVREIWMKNLGKSSARRSFIPTQLDQLKHLYEELSNRAKHAGDEQDTQDYDLITQANRWAAIDLGEAIQLLVHIEALTARERGHDKTAISKASNYPESLDEQLAHIKAKYPTFQFQLYDLIAAGDILTMDELISLVVRKPLVDNSARDADDKKRIADILEIADQEEREKESEKDTKRRLDWLHKIETELTAYFEPFEKAAKEQSDRKFVEAETSSANAPDISAQLDQLKNLHGELSNRAKRAEAEQDEEEQKLLTEAMIEAARKIGDAIRLLIHIETLSKTKRQLLTP